MQYMVSSGGFSFSCIFAMQPLSLCDSVVRQKRDARHDSSWRWCSTGHSVCFDSTALRMF